MAKTSPSKCWSTGEDWTSPENVRVEEHGIGPEAPRGASVALADGADHLQLGDLLNVREGHVVPQKGAHSPPTKRRPATHSPPPTKRCHRREDPTSPPPARSSSTTARPPAQAPRRGPPLGCPEREKVPRPGPPAAGPRETPQLLDNSRRCPRPWTTKRRK